MTLVVKPIEKKFHYPAVAVDTLVTCGFKILLIKRKDNGKFALPGGFLEEGETLFAASLRELKEETAINTDSLVLMNKRMFDDPTRDPRGHIITMAHHFVDTINLIPPPVKPWSDAKEAGWHNVFLVLDHYELYADHKKIIKEMLSNA